MFSPAPRSLTDYAAQVEAIAEQLASMVKAAGKNGDAFSIRRVVRLANPERITMSGFDGAISDFEPAWTPEHGAGCESAATVGVGCDCCRADGSTVAANRPPLAEDHGDDVPQPWPAVLCELRR